MLVVTMGVACASGPRAAGTEGEAHERNCAFETLRESPGPAYVEIARISMEGDANFGTGRYRDTRQFASALREMVCELGGDAVKTEVDAHGIAVRAIVFRRSSAGVQR